MSKFIEEMNYLSEKIDKYENSITELEILSAQQSGYNYSLQKLRKEKNLLENILNKLTETETLQLNIGAVSGSSGSERIICAAVWYKEIPIKKEIPFESTNPKNCPTGLVFSGHRHGQCIYTKCAVTGLRDAESGENEQGFLTSKNRFVSREEALIIALRENQVMDVKKIRGNTLFSEDLY